MSKEIRDKPSNVETVLFESVEREVNSKTPFSWGLLSTESQDDMPFFYLGNGVGILVCCTLNHDQHLCYAHVIATNKNINNLSFAIARYIMKKLSGVYFFDGDGEEGEDKAVKAINERIKEMTEV